MSVSLVRENLRENIKHKILAIEVITSTNTTLQSLDIPGEKRLKTEATGTGIGPQAAPAAVPGATPVYSVIQTANPISALYEYCKKGKGKVQVFFKGHCQFPQNLPVFLWC